MFFKGNRNTISNVEIQDIYNKCAIFENFNNNILNINLDGIRTHITDDASIVLAEFVNCSRNVINLISSKYGSSVNDSSKDDIISLNSNCNTNSLILSSLKVALQDGGVKNNITVLKNDIVSYNIDKILTLEETYSAKKNRQRLIMLSVLMYLMNIAMLCTLLKIMEMLITAGLGSR